MKAKKTRGRPSIEILVIDEHLKKVNVYKSISECTTVYTEINIGTLSKSLKEQGFLYKNEVFYVKKEIVLQYFDVDLEDYDTLIEIRDEILGNNRFLNLNKKRFQIDVPKCIYCEKLNESAKIPQKAHPLDSGFDLYSNEDISIAPMERMVIPLGIRLEFPENWGGEVRGRSGLNANSNLMILHGTIDSNYRGELKCVAINTSLTENYHIKKGDKIAQLVLEYVPNTEILCVDGIDIKTDRSLDGFGSSGMK